MIAICDMPTGVAGLNGITRWAVLDDAGDPSRRTPPLVPIKLLKTLDTVHEAKHKKLIFREAGVIADLEELDPSEHQTLSMMDFDEEGWALPEDLKEIFVATNGRAVFS